MRDILGAPIGIQLQIEYGAFAVIGLLMGWLGTEQLAGHQVALNLASFTFMVPLGIGAALYTTQAAVLVLAARLIPIAGVFQVFDGLQVVAGGILRGAGDTRVPMVINVVAFWIVMMPLCLFLGFRTSLGAVGL